MTRPVTIDEFKRYLDVQKSAVTNMYSIPIVCQLTDLNVTQVLYIMENYYSLKKQYDLIGGAINE